MAFYDAQLIDDLKMLIWIGIGATGVTAALLLGLAVGISIEHWLLGRKLDAVRREISELRGLLSKRGD